MVIASVISMEKSLVSGKYLQLAQRCCFSRAFPPPPPFHVTSLFFYFQILFYKKEPPENFNFMLAPWKLNSNPVLSVCHACWLSMGLCHRRVWAFTNETCNEQLLPVDVLDDCLSPEGWSHSCFMCFSGGNCVSAWVWFPKILSVKVSSSAFHEHFHGLKAFLKSSTAHVSFPFCRRDGLSGKWERIPFPPLAAWEGKSVFQWDGGNGQQESKQLSVTHPALSPVPHPSARAVEAAVCN